MQQWNAKLQRNDLQFWEIYSEKYEHSSFQVFMNSPVTLVSDTASSGLSISIAIFQFWMVSWILRLLLQLS